MYEAPTEDEVSPLPIAGRRRPVDEWLLVLRAEGLDAELCRVSGGFSIRVPPGDEARALEILETWRAENAESPTPPEAGLPLEAHPVHLALAYLTMLGLLAEHVLAEHAGVYAHWKDVGSAQAAHIVAGQLWRAATALTLHSGLAHVSANVAIGGLFLGVLARRLGIGVGLLAVLLSGFLGNLANALYYRAAHDSIGASTAVFGCVGILGGLEAWRRRRLALPWRGAWLPLGGSLGLLAMLGVGGGDVDYGAHIAGLVAGLGIGFALAPRLGLGPPPLWMQLAAGAGATLGLGLAWWLALAAG